MVTFKSGNDMNFTVHGNQTITETHTTTTTITVCNELKKDLEPIFAEHHIPQATQQEILQCSQELVEAIEKKEVGKFKRILTLIREKGPDVADYAIAKAMEYGIKLLPGLALL